MLVSIKLFPALTRAGNTGDTHMARNDDNSKQASTTGAQNDRYGRRDDNPSSADAAMDQ